MCSIHSAAGEPPWPGWLGNSTANRRARCSWNGSQRPAPPALCRNRSAGPAPPESRRTGTPRTVTSRALVIPQAAARPDVERDPERRHLAARPLPRWPREPRGGPAVAARGARREDLLGAHDPARAAHNVRAGAAPPRQPSARRPLGASPAGSPRRGAAPHARAGAPPGALDADAPADRVVPLRRDPVGLAPAAPLRGRDPELRGPRPRARGVFRDGDSLLVADHRAG